MMSMAVQRLMAVFFHRWQGVTLESKSTSSHVLRGLSPDWRARQQCGTKHLRSEKGKNHVRYRSPNQLFVVLIFSASDKGQSGRAGWLNSMVVICLHRLPHPEVSCLTQLGLFASQYQRTKYRWKREKKNQRCVSVWEAHSILFFKRWLGSGSRPTRHLFAHYPSGGDNYPDDL